MLPHWTISQFVLGYPIVGDHNSLGHRSRPLELATRRRALDEARSTVTEVHPTLAAWYWLRSSTAASRSAWEQYKGKVDGRAIRAGDVSARVERMWAALLSRVEIDDPYPLTDQGGHRMTADEFDARVAWLLGHLWISTERVDIFGSLDHGTFLLPREATEDVRTDLLQPADRDNPQDGRADSRGPSRG